jgi:hypothetical protein
VGGVGGGGGGGGAPGLYSPPLFLANVPCSSVEGCCLLYGFP